MPYIPTRDRLQIDYVIKLLLDSNSTDTFKGRFNYLIHKLAKEYIARYGQRYSVYQLIIGELECAKLELYRKQTVPYEDIKESENGAV